MIQTYCFRPTAEVQLSDVDEGIDVVVIDHESTDSTVKVCKEFIGRGLLHLGHLTWNGQYDQTGQLNAKAKVAEQLQHDWIIHTDADERLEFNVSRSGGIVGYKRFAVRVLEAAGSNSMCFQDASHRALFLCQATLIS